MEDKIIQYLAQLEKELDIEILLACETGSRAWGFPSPDSDYDVRIIYKHKKDWYLNLQEPKDSLLRFYENNDIDISGWDLRKSLRLIWKSNPALLERIQSPIIYRSNPDFLKGIHTIAAKTFSRIRTIHHYLSMAKKMLSDMDVEKGYRLKTFFYALRSSVACLWILEKENMPPIEFEHMLEGLAIDRTLLDRIEELIALKSTVSEAYLHKGESELFQFMESCISRAEAGSKALPSGRAEMEDLNTFFKTMLG